MRGGPFPRDNEHVRDARDNANTEGYVLPRYTYHIYHIPLIRTPVSTISPAHRDDKFQFVRTIEVCNFV